MAVELLAVLKEIKEAIDLVDDVRKKRAEKEQAHQMVVRLFGSILFEMRVNCERVRWLAAQKKLFEEGEATRWGGVLNFDVSDALLTDFCKSVPDPNLLSDVQWVLAALKQVDFHLRAANGGPPIPKPDDRMRVVFALPDSDKHRLVAEFSHYFIEKGLIDRFNRLVGTAGVLG